MGGRLRTLLTSWKTFMVVITLTGTVGTVKDTYIDSVLPDLEKQFNLKSSESGALVSAPAIGMLPFIVFASYLCGRWSVPPLVGITYFVIGCMCLIIASTRLIVTSQIAPVPINQSDVDYSFQQFCNITVPSPSYTPTGPASTSAYIVFFLAYLVTGSALIPQVTLLPAFEEDIVPKRLYPVVIGAHMGFSSLGSFLGTSLAGWCSSLYVTLEKDPPLKTDDPSWIGAWWLGFVVVGVCYILVTPVMFVFPRDLDKVANRRSELENSVEISDNVNTTDDGSERSSDGSDDDDDDGVKETYKLKDLPHTLRRLLSNRLFVVFVLIYSVGSFDLGDFSFKYFVSQFRVPNFKANLMIGMSGAVSSGVSVIIGGLIVSYFRFSFRRTLFWCFLMWGIYIGFDAGNLLLHCDIPPIYGVNSTSGAGVSNVCNSGCNCTLEAYTPVCDQGMTYFSACHAGCSGMSNLTAANETSIPRTYTDCACTETGSAIAGLCPASCPVWLAFFLMFASGDFLDGLIDSPEQTALLRSVERRDKSIAMGTIILFQSIIDMSSPSIGGAIIDTTCLVWGESSTGSRENCWIYNFTDNRFKFMGTDLAQTVIICLLYGFAYILSKEKSKKNEITDECEEDTIPILT